MLPFGMFFFFFSLSILNRGLIQNFGSTSCKTKNSLPALIVVRFSFFLFFRLPGGYDNVNIWLLKKKKVDFNQLVACLLGLEEFFLVEKKCLERKKKDSSSARSRASLVN